MAYLGKTPSQAVRSRYFYTATGGETSLSGADNNGDTLIFADGNYVDVYLNGVLLVAGTDYNVNTTNTIAGLVALTASDIVEIVVYDTFSVFGGTFQGALTADSINADIFGSHQFTARNVQGSTILKGTPVYIAGHSGNDPEIAIADADVTAKMPAFGIAATDIANNTKGNVVVFGNYIGIDTSAFAVGDELYVSNTGTLTTTRPSGSADKVQKIAKVIRSQSQNGQIFVMGAGRSNDTPNAITTNSINLSSSTIVSSVLDEDAMTSDSATALATQQSIKAYVDNQIGSNNELSEILTNGNTTSGNDIAFGDNDKAIFGAGSDLQVYHDGSASIVYDNGIGPLNLQTNNSNINIKGGGSASDTMAIFKSTEGVDLYYNNVKKFETTATGIDISNSSGATLKLTSTDTSGADTELLGQIDFVSSDVSGGSAGTQARIKGVYEDNGDSSGLAFLTGASTGSGSPTLNEVMRIRHEGSVGIGTVSPTSSVSSSQTGLHIADTNVAYLSLDNTNTNGHKYTLFSDDTGSLKIFDVDASSYRMVLDSSGNLLVGKTTLEYSSNAGHVLRNDGLLSAVRSGGNVANLNRLSSDGEIIQLNKDGTRIGSIGNTGTELYIGTPSGSDGYIRFQSQGLVPCTSTGANSDGTMQLGTASGRFSDLYLSGGVYLGGTGSANHLDDYEVGTWNPSFTLGSGTATGVAYGRYIKVGQLVYVTFYLQITSGSGGIDYITNLPFVSENSGSWAGIGNVRETSQTGYQWHTYVNVNQNYMLLRRYDNTNSFATNYVFVGSVTYTTP